MRVIYQPVQMAVRNGEVYLQVVPRVPGFAEANLSLVRGLAAEAGLTSRIDWDVVKRALQRREAVPVYVATAARPVI